TLRDEVLRTMLHIHRHDHITKEAADDEYDTELTRLAKDSVEIGVNEITGGPENHDDDFKVKKGASASVAAQKKNAARKKKKGQRQNKKKSRK
ncbi:MAG: preprotein translocase subunit SecA, partial [Candidatus Saccharimonadaceae bacterium]